MLFPKRQLQSRGQTQNKMPKSIKFSRKSLLIVIIVLATLAIIALVTLSTLGIISTALAAITSTVAGVLGAVFAFLPLVSSEKKKLEMTSSPAMESLRAIPSNTALYSITSAFLPLTDPQVIQQRRMLVEDVYIKLIQPNVNAVVLTGMGGIGKSTLAALIYHYAREKCFDSRDKFSSSPLWLTINSNTTFVDLVHMISQSLGNQEIDLSNLTPQNQASVLFNLLNIMDRPRLVILDQFENLLDWETGYALTNRPGVGEWIDILNSQLHTTGSSILFTSRLRPKGTHEYALTYIEEYPVEGLEVAEGVDLLHKRGVQSTETDLQTAVVYCKGHPLSLTLLATLIHDYGSDLTTMLKSPVLWEDVIATNLLDFIYEQQLSKEQRELLLAFSIYRIPVPLEAAQALTTKIPQPQFLSALKVLLMQHLVEATGKNCYQLHSIIANYAKRHFNKRSKKLNDQILQDTHIKAAQYYLRLFGNGRVSWNERHEINDFQPLIEAIWHYCQSSQWRDAYDLMTQEDVFSELNGQGENAILLELYQLLIPLSRWNPKSSEAASIYHESGWVCNDLGRTQVAQDYFLQELSILKEIGDRKEEASALCSLGLAYDNMGKHQQALDCFQRALNIQRDMRDRKEEATTLNNLGNLYDDLGNTQQAFDCLQQALKIYREVGDSRGEGVALNNLGSIYTSLGNEQQALAHYKQALLLRREVRDYNGEGTTLNNLGLTYCELGDNQQAIDHFRQALLIQRKVGDRRGEGYILLNIGTLCFEQNQYYTSLASLLLAQTIFEEVLSPERDRVQRWLDNIYEIVGEEVFNVLFIQVKPQAHQIVEQFLSKEI